MKSTSEALCLVAAITFCNLYAPWWCCSSESVAIKPATAIAVQPKAEAASIAAGPASPTLTASVGSSTVALPAHSPAKKHVRYQSKRAAEMNCAMPSPQALINREIDRILSSKIHHASIERAMHTCKEYRAGMSDDALKRKIAAQLLLAVCVEGGNKHLMPHLSFLTEAAAG